MIPKPFWLFLVVTPQYACTGSLGGANAAQPDRCVQLDDRRMWTGAVAKGSAALAGVSGLATIPLEEGPAQTGVAIGGVVAAAVAAGAVYVSEGAGESWSRECAKP